MISERLHDVQDVQEHLGDKWRGLAGGQRRVVVTSTGDPYQMKSQRGRHGVGETSVEGDICCLKVREERPPKTS